MPKHRILGTQRPIKIACSAFPVKNSISEYIRDRSAEIKSNLSDNVNFLNIGILTIFIHLLDQMVKL